MAHAPVVTPAFEGHPVEAEAAPTAAPPYLTRIGGWRIDSGSPALKLVDVGEIAFIFLGSAVAAGRFEASWVSQYQFTPGGIYFRTVGGGLYRTTRSPLTALRERLDPATFVNAYRDVLANAERVMEIDFSNKQKQVGFRIRDTTEYVQASRRAARALADRYWVGSSAGRRHAPEMSPAGES